MSFLSSTGSLPASLRHPNDSANDPSVDRGEFEACPDRHGVFAWWPDEDDAWIHPYDRPLAKDFIPSDRVWQRFRGDSQYDLYCYGGAQFRAEPRMWVRVDIEGFWLGDWVEVLSDFGKRRAFVGQISDVYWNRQAGVFEYGLLRQGRSLPRRFRSNTFRPCQSLTRWEDREVRRHVQASEQLDRSVTKATPWS